MNTTNSLLSRRNFTIKSALSLASIAIGSMTFPCILSSCKNRNGNSVPSLSGNIDCDKLGTTLMHEHVLFGNIPDDMRSASVDVAVKLLNEAKEAGVDTLVDMSPYRDMNLYKEIAGRTNVNIIASTGYYICPKTPSLYQNMSEAQLEERMYKEVTEGIDGTNIRAGIIKIAADLPVTDWEKKVFCAAAKVQKATGVSIATHAWTGALEQFALLVKSGANPNKLNFAHIETKAGWEGRNREKFAEDFLTIVKEGGYLLFNNFGCEFYTPWADMVYLMRYFCDKGYGNRIFISQDCNWEWKNGRQVFEEELNHPEAGKRTYAYMMNHEIPLMLNSGFNKKEIETFLIHNPREFFSR